MCKESVLIFTLLVSFYIDAGAQRFVSLNDQFPFARSRCVYQDSYGFLWFGTVDGLVKFDGVSTKLYRNTPGDTLSFPGKEIHAIVQHSDTTLLLGFQEEGMVMFNRNSGISNRIELVGGNQRLAVYSLLMEKKGLVWIGTNRGLYSWDGLNVIHYASNPQELHGLQHPYVSQVYEDKNQNLWIGTREGIHLLNRESGSFENPLTNSSFPDQIIIDITEDQLGKLWVSVRLGSNRLYTWDQAASKFDIEGEYVRSGEYRIDFDVSNDLWISSRGRGVSEITHKGETFYDPAQSWSHGFWGLGNFNILHDSYHNIWVLGEEVFKLSGDHKDFNHIRGDNFVVHSVYADDQFIWYCAENAIRWNRKTGERTQFLENFPMSELRNPEALRSQKRVYHFEEWGEDLVMSTTRNMILWDRDKDRFVDLPTDAGGPLRDFVIDSNGYAWVAVNQRTPMRMQLPNGNYTREEILNPAWTTHSVELSPDGTQWWGNRLQGLFSFNPGDGELIHFEPNPEHPEKAISSHEIHDILCHTDGTIWIGTKYGLDEINPKTRLVKNYNILGEQINTQITSLLEGENGELWMGTKNGLLFLNPATDSLRRFTKDDGLINTVYTERACYKDHDGVLYFGGDGGIDYFHPNTIGRNPVAPDLYIKSVKVNNRPVKQTISGGALSELSLSYKENFIEIELIGIHLASPHSVTYSYRLSSKSTEWINLDRSRIISLAQLPPGEYILEARCANGDGILSTPKKVLSIVIHPPFWKTAWFIGLISIIILSSFLALHRFRIQQIRNAEQIKSEFTKRIAELEMKALRAQMNPHFLFNSLNSVSLLVDKGENTQAKIYLAKYSQLIRKILNNSRKKFIRLDEELQTLKLYLELEKIRFKNFIYQFNIDENVEIDFLDFPPLLLQPYVENAIWHGLMNKEKGEKLLTIDVNKVDENVIITIEDNGIGREQARLHKTRSASKKESFGISISSDRIGYLKKLYGKNVGVEIEDLQNPTGTRVIIRFPVSD